MIGMKVFQMREIEEALAFSAAGGIAVHLHDIVFDHSPQCFKDDVAKGRQIAHMFCLDRGRLLAVAKAAGVNVLYVDRDGTPSQHVDLCGSPLKAVLRKSRREPE